MKSLEIYLHRMGTLVLMTLACQPAGKNTETGAATGEDSTGEASAGGDPSGDSTTTTMASDATAPGDSTTLDEGESTSADTMVVDMGTPPPPMCDVWMQDCEDGQKCMPVDMNVDGYNDANQCVPVDANPKEVGESCSQADGGLIDNCRKGAQCMTELSMGEAIEGICVALCGGTPSAPTCDDGKSCAIWQGGIEPWCVEKCDILAQDCTTPGWMCSYAAMDSAGCVVDMSGPTGAKNDPCACDPGCCDPGLFCFPAGQLAMCDSASCCTEYCDVKAPDCSGAGGGEECVPSGNIIGPVPGLEDVGICIIPA